MTPPPPKSSAAPEARKLRNRLRRYARHRLRMMNNYGALKTPERVYSAERIIRRLDFYKRSPKLAKVIAGLEGDAYRIRPGAKSKYLEGAIRELGDIFSSVKSLLNDTD